MLIVDALIQNRQFRDFTLAISREPCYISERLVGRRDLSVRLPEGPQRSSLVSSTWRTTTFGPFRSVWKVNTGRYCSPWEKFDGDEVVCR